MPNATITDVLGQRKAVQGTQELQRELNLYVEAMDNLVEQIDSDDDAVAARAMRAARELKARHDLIMESVPEFNRLHEIEQRDERKRYAAELRKWRAERNGEPPPD